MRTSRMLAAAALAITAGLGAGVPAAAGAARGNDLTPEAEAFTAVTRSTAWETVQRIPLDFETHHPQGMALVGDLIYLSSVEIIERTVRYPQPVDGYDRTAGRGQGHVFVITREGELVADIEVGEGDMYHPGGIDFDGEKVWVPVAEYRPNSASVIYSIDPETLEVTEELRHGDHVGGAVMDQKTNRLTGVSWGSRKLFTWNSQDRLLSTVANPNHMLDYQDCDYAGAGHQLCGGITGLATPTGGSYELGGLALTDLTDGSVVHEVPMPIFSAAGHTITRNPVALEADGDVLRLFAAPDDGEEIAGTELLVLESRPAR